MTTDLAIREVDLDARKFIVLHPIVQVIGAHRSPILAESWAAVQILPESADTYNDFRYANKKDGKFALTAVALGKIAAAAGIRWITEECGVETRERSPDGHVYIAYRATGAVRQPNGEWYKVTAHRDLDTSAELEQIVDEKVRKWRRETNAGPEELPPDAIMLKVQDDAKRDILQIRENALQLVETKARNRVIRALLSLQQVYTKAELARPFAVPRLIYRPDLVDARALEAAQIEGAQAAADVYGPPAAAPIAVSREASGALPAAADDGGAAQPEPRSRRRGSGGTASGPGRSAGTREGGPSGRPGPAPPDDPVPQMADHVYVGDGDGPCQVKDCGLYLEAHRTQQGRLA